MREYDLIRNSDTSLPLLLAAVEHWDGWTQTSVPLLVDPDIMDHTCPPGATDKRLTHSSGKQHVASAEQSFLQLEKELRIWDDQFMALTPCYRDESVLDDTHLNIFMKLELFWYNPYGDLQEGLDEVVEQACDFWKGNGVPVRTVQTDEGIDILFGDGSFEIHPEWGSTELGSFGIRKSPKGVTYIYGTALAEPRASQAVKRSLSIVACSGCDSRLGEPNYDEDIFLCGGSPRCCP